MKIKVKALSLAILSIAWIGQVNAQSSWTGNGCTNSSQTDCTISSQVGSLTGSGNLTITDSGSVVASGGSSGANAINASGTFTIKNSGTISASNQTHGIKVNGNGTYSGSITNNATGTISGKWNGISVETGTNSGSVAIDNSGAISGASGKGIFINGSGLTVTIQNSGTINGSTGDSGVGINVQSAASDSTIENSGNVSGRIGISTGTDLKSIHLKSGTVYGAFRGLEIYKKVETLTLDSGATISAPSDVGTNSTWQLDGKAALSIYGGSVSTLNNSGSIQGATGILVRSKDARIENLNNSGTIESTAPNDWASAITLIYAGGNAGTLGTVKNQSGGVIRAVSGNGISLEFGTTLDAFINEGTVDVGHNGLNFFNEGYGSGVAKIGKIELKNGSTIKAGNIGLNLSIPNSNAEVGTIDVQSGASIVTQSGSAIVIGSTVTVTGSGATTNGAGSNTPINGPYIKLAGTLTSPTSTFVNNGLIGASGHSGTVILIDSNATFNGSDQTNIVNKGTINGDIEFTNTQNASFANPGILNGRLIVKGTGNVTIDDWAMSVVPTEDGTGAKVESVTVDTSANQGKVIVDHVSINDISSSLMGKDIDFSKAFVTQDGTEIRLKDDPTAVTIGSVPSSLGFDGTYDAQTNKFYTSFNIAQTAGAVVSQTLANQLMRRDFFLESAVTEAATGSLYHRKLDGVEGTAFVKPYASNDTFDLKGAKMDGTTQGVMLGINRFVGRHLLTGYVGFERSEIDSDFRSSTMNLDVQSWYGGFNTAHLLQSNSFVDTFLKGSLKASYTTTGIDRQILLNANTTNSDNVVGSNASVIQSSAKPNTVAVGMNVQLGMNFKPMKETQIIPMVGLGYSIGKTSSYQLDRTGLINDSYMPERVMMPYADASVTWFQGWGKIVRTFVGGGMRYILDRTQKTALSYGKLPIEGEYSLPQSFQYVNASMVLHMSAASEIALGYTGVFDSTGHSQNLTAKYELHF